MALPEDLSPAMLMAAPAYLDAGRSASSSDRCVAPYELFSGNSRAKTWHPWSYLFLTRAISPKTKRDSFTPEQLENHPSPIPRRLPTSGMRAPLRAPLVAALTRVLSLF
jgi:hypothetical protein